MFFRLSNAPASFQGYINNILTKKLNVFIIVYLDNILIYTMKAGQPYMEAVHWVFDQLWKHKLFANLKICQFHQDEVWFLDILFLYRE